MNHRLIGRNSNIRKAAATVIAESPSDVVVYAILARGSVKLLLSWGELGPDLGEIVAFYTSPPHSPNRCLDDCARVVGIFTEDRQRVMVSGQGRVTNCYTNPAPLYRAI